MPGIKDSKNEPGSDWTKWSMFLIEGLQSMKSNITELYQIAHDLDKHDTEERQNIINHFSKELFDFKTFLQNEIFKLNTEIVKIQIKLAIWAGIVAFSGTLLGSIVVSYVKKILFGSAE